MQTAPRFISSDSHVTKSSSWNLESLSCELDTVRGQQRQKLMARILAGIYFQGNRNFKMPWGSATAFGNHGRGSRIRTAD